MRPDGSEPIAGPARARQRTALPGLLLLLAAVLAAIHLALPIASLPLLAPRGYNEGWNAYHAEAVLSERPLYPGPSELFPNNYPPLSFAVVALAGRTLGDPIRAGRLLSLAALLALGLEILWLARGLTGSLRLGIFAALTFGASLAAAFPAYVAMNDPQLLANALVLGGALVVATRQSPARLALAAALMLSGGLVKHNVIALPLALTAWLLGRDRRDFGLWVALSLLLVAAALAALGWLYGASFFTSLLGPRHTSLALAANATAESLPSLAPLLVLALLAVQEAWGDRDARLLAWYAGLGLVLGVLFSAGEGVAVNAYFDLLIALCLLVPFLLARVEALVPSGARVIPTAALALAALLGPLLAAPRALLELPADLELASRVEAATREDVAYLASREAPVLCEMLALCFWSGQPPTLDLFNSRQRFRAGASDEEALLARVERGEFSVVQLYGIFPDREDERVSAQLTHALRRHYEVDRVSANGVFLRPLGSAGAR